MSDYMFYHQYESEGNVRKRGTTGSPNESINDVGMVTVIVKEVHDKVK